jgi:capsid protein
MVAIADKRRFILGPDGLPVVRAGYGYDAVESSHRRRVPATILSSADRELPPEDRRSMVSTTRDLKRNFTIAAWAIRKHLDYVSTFSFQSKCGNDDLDGQVETFMRWWSLPIHCDVAARHPLRRFIRLAEERRTVDGDVFVLKLADGRVQAIEGDRVRAPVGGMPSEIGIPLGVDPSRFSHGVVLDGAGAATAYAVCRRAQGMGFLFERMLRADRVLHHGYFDRFDQVRGISPLAPAINTYRDCYEGMDYALAKLKVSQLFGLVFFREAAEEMGIVTPETPDAGEGAAAGDHYKVDLGKGPFKLELDAGDRAEWLETKTPAAETAAFLQRMIDIALKGLDIPYSFFDESFTNFFGSRGALNHYLQSAHVKRQENRDLLDELTRWRLGLAVDDGAIRLPAGVRVEDLAWDWVPKGLAWWNPEQEVNADIAAVGGGLKSRQRICRDRGDDFFEIADEISEENKYLSQRNLSTEMKPANTQITEITGGKGK